MRGLILIFILEWRVIEQSHLMWLAWYIALLADIQLLSKTVKWQKGQKGTRGAPGDDFDQWIKKLSLANMSARHRIDDEWFADNVCIVFRRFES